MRSRSAALPALSLLSCSLTFLASGDDFCLPRLIFPTAFSVSHSLPLDDPNSDFLDATSSCQVRQSVGDTCHDHGHDPLLIAGPGDFASPATLLFPSLANSSPAHRPPLGTEQTFPLRC